MVSLGVADAVAPPAVRADVGGYTDQLLLAQEAAATMGHAITAGAQIGIGLWERAFMLAEAEGPGAEVLTAPLLAQIARNLATRGEAVLHASLDGAVPALWLSLCSDWSVIGGGVDSRSWRYLLTMSGVTQQRNIKVGADETVHVRINVDGRQLWRGRSPLAVAGGAGSLAQLVERALREEYETPVRHVVPMPASLEGLTQADVNATRQAFQSHAHRHLFPPSTQRKGADVPQTDWKGMRYGFDAHDSHPKMLGAVTRAVAALYGVPGPLAAVDTDPAGPSQREAWRLFLSSTIAPLGALIEAEIGRVFGAPVRLKFGRLNANDLTARARALHVLVQSEVPLSEAREVAGL